MTIDHHGRSRIEFVERAFNSLEGGGEEEGKRNVDEGNEILGDFALFRRLVIGVP